MGLSGLAMASAAVADVAAAGEVTEVAKGVFAYVQPDGGWCLNNAGIIVDGECVALVDTAATRRRALALKRAVADVAPQPPSLIANTHSHGDHTFGNRVFGEAMVVGHERCRAEMQYAGLHLTGLWPAVDWGWGAADVLPPEMTFPDRAVLWIGGIEVRLLHVGPAHTTGDTVVWLPEQRVLFTGDVVMSGVTPFIAMGSLSGSLAAIALLRGLGAQTIVPGHGPVGGTELLDATEGYLRWVGSLATDAARSGVSALDAARAARPGPYGDLIDAERLVPNLRRALAERDGAEPGAPLDMPALFAELVEFHGGLPACRA